MTHSVSNCDIPCKTSYKGSCRILSLFVAIAIFSQFAIAGHLTVEEKTLDFQQLLGRIKSAYGPLDYKKESLNIDIDQLQTQYLRKVQDSKTNDEFYYVINQFVAEFKDSHFAAMTPSNRRSALPFNVDLIQGKVLVDEKNESVPYTGAYNLQKAMKLLTSMEFPFKTLFNHYCPTWAKVSSKLANVMRRGC